MCEVGWNGTTCSSCKKGYELHPQKVFSTNVNLRLSQITCPSTSVQLLYNGTHQTPDTGDPRVSRAMSLVGEGIVLMGLVELVNVYAQMIHLVTHVKHASAGPLAA